MANEDKDKQPKDEDVPFRNESIKMIRSLMNENAKLRDTISNAANKRKSNSSRRVSYSTNIAGLQGLGSPIKLS